MKFSSFLAKIRPKRKWLKITWRKVEIGPWKIPWIDKAYIFGKRFHHLELGLILIFIGWILVIHDWFVHERPKLVGVSIEWEAEDYEKREDGTVIIRGARIVISVPFGGSRSVNATLERRSAG